MAVVLAATAAIAVISWTRADRGAVTVEGGPQGNQLHEFNGDHHAPFISITDYKPIYDRGDKGYVLVDVRGAHARRDARIPGDIWVPLADMDSTGWRALLEYNDRTIVLYCECPWAEAAYASVILIARGFSEERLRVLHEGLPGWESQGYPVQRDDAVCARKEWAKACDS